MTALPPAAEWLDLPPFWDGEPVQWDPWKNIRTTLALHLPADALACDKCGTVDEPATCWGSRPAYPGPHPIRDLSAARCRHCGHDVVTDHRTDQTWDLEPEDYGPAGSHPTETLF